MHAAPLRPSTGLAHEIPFLLWMLGRLMAKASRENPAFQQLLGRDMVFQLHTLDGKKLPVSSSSKTNAHRQPGPASEPAFALGFRMQPGRHHVCEE
jgi:hypothetical protein